MKAAEGHRRESIGAPLLAVALSMTAAVAAFAATAGFGFVWDDYRIPRSSAPAITDLYTLFFPPHGIADFGRYYRPVSYAVWWFDWYAGGGEPRLFHQTAVALHALCSGLVAWLAYRLLRRWEHRALGALLAGTMFAVHPVQVESVAWIGAMVGTVSSLFVLAALIAYDGSLRRDSPALALVAATLGLGALLGRETALALPILAVGLELLDPWRGRTAIPRTPSAARWLRLGGMAAALGIYLGLRRLAMGAWIMSPETIEVAPQPLSVLPAAASHYAARMLAPLHSCHFVPAVAPISAIHVLAAAAALVAVAVLIRASGRRAAAPIYAAFWVAVTLTPVLALAAYPAGVTPIADRYLYLPAVGACVLLAAAAIAPGALRNWRIAAAIAAVLASGAATAERREAFRNNTTFWRAAAACAPEHCLPVINFGNAALERGALPEAETLLRRALTLECPDRQRGLALAHLGWVLLDRGVLEEAQPLLEEAVPLVPDYANAAYLLASCETRRARAADAGGSSAEAAAHRQRASVLLERAVALQPENPEFLYTSGQAAAAAGNADVARSRFSAALERNPQHRLAAAARAFLAQRGR